MGARSSQSRGPGVNKSDGHLLQYFRNTFGAAGGAGTTSDAQGLTATGGVIGDYTTGPGDVYRAHVFTSSGTFDVTAIGAFPADVEYLVVAGGGSGGYEGGGGAGGLRTNLSGHPLATGNPSFTASIAYNAALALRVSKIVSTKRRSDPPSINPKTCSLYAITNSSNVIALYPGSLTSGDMLAVLFVGPIEPATYLFFTGVFPE